MPDEVITVESALQRIEDYAQNMRENGEVDMRSMIHEIKTIKEEYASQKDEATAEEV